MTKVYDNATDLITFARSSSGTALRRVGYGDELVTNGTFDTDTSGWSAASASTLSSVSGKLRVTNTSTYGLAYQSVSVVAGRTYTFTVTEIAGTAAARPRLGSSLGNNDIWQGSTTSSGSFTETFTFTATTSVVYIGLYAQTTVSGEYADYDNVSVKEVIFDRATDPLVLFNHPDDTPRIEYDGSDGSLKGLLIEEQRTNLLTYSVPDITNWPTFNLGTGQTPVVTENSAVAPDGTSTATKIEFDVGGGTTSTDRSLLTSPTASSITSGVAYTGSVWLKGANGGEVVVLRHVGESTYSEITLTSGWSRYDITETSVDTAAILSFGLKGNQTGQTAIVYAWGFQLEEGSFATSYIPTSGSTVTRSADIASIPVTAFGYNQTAGTVVVEALAPVGYGHNRLVMLVDAGTLNNRVVDLYREATDVKMYEGSTVLSPPTPSDPATGLKVAGAYSSGDYAAVVDGGSPATSTTVSVNTPDTLFIGSNGLSQNQLNGHIKSIQYFPRRLTDAQLQELTS